MSLTLLNLLRHKTDVDLEIVVTTEAADAGKFLHFELRTAKPGIKFEQHEFEGRAVDDLEKLLNSNLKRIDDRGGGLLSGEEIVEMVEKIGYDLYREIIPKKLREEFWRLRSEEIRTLLISSEETWIPWEIIKPSEGGEHLDFLCMEYRLGRQLITEEEKDREAETRLLDRLFDFVSDPVRDLYVPKAAAVTVATSYVEGAPDLQAADEDLKTLENLFETKTSDFIKLPEAGYRDFKKLLDKESFGLFHFAGHGDLGSSSDQADLHLADRGVGPSFLSGPVQHKLRKDRPLVFLNACNAARPSGSLMRLEGWAERWLGECGAGAFIAPLLSVRDKRAAELARRFYGYIGRGQTLGEAVQRTRLDLRAQQPGDPTWLAYSFFGHPEAKVVFEERSRPQETLEWLRKRVRRVLVLLLALLLTSLILLLRPPPPMTVAVLSPVTADNPADESENWRSAAVAELLHEALVRSSGVDSVDRQRVVELEDAWNRSRAQPGQTMAEAFREVLGVDCLLRFSYSEVDGTATLNLAPRSTDSGAARWCAEDLDPIEETVSELPTLVYSATELLSRPLHFEPLSNVDQTKVTDSLPIDAESASSYLRGLESYRGSDLVSAWKNFEETPEASYHPRLTTAMARILSDIGHPEAAAKWLAKAQSYPGLSNLPEREQVLISAWRAQTKGEWLSALEEYQALHAANLEDVAACIQGAESLRRAELPEEALVSASQCGQNLTAYEKAELALVQARAQADLALLETDERAILDQWEAALATLNVDEALGNWIPDFLASPVHLMREVFERVRSHDNREDELRDFLKSYTPSRALVKDCLSTSSFFLEEGKYDLGGPSVARWLLGVCLDSLVEDDPGRALLQWRLGELALEKQEFDKALSYLDPAEEELQRRGARLLAAELSARTEALSREQEAEKKNERN